MTPPNNSQKPLAGIRVLELGQLIAGPFAGNILAYFGAEVIKVEPPGRGDPLRQWRVLKDGTSLWWRSIARNKKCITLNLKHEKGKQLAKQLTDKVDVVIENFKPGTLEKWGLAPDELKKTNPGLIVSRISGFGQTGPYASQVGFASACEAYGGMRYVNGHPGEAPVRTNLSLGDTLAGLHAVIGILISLIYKGKTGQGQEVDVAIYESVFNCLEGVIPEYTGAGVIREPSGTTVTGIVPTNTYLCKDNKYVVIGGNGDSIFKRLMQAAGRDDLADDSRLIDNEGRVKHEKEIDEAISAWTKTLTSLELLDCLNEAQVPRGPIYSVADMVADPHFQARSLFEDVEVEGEIMQIPAMVPKLSETPGQTEWAGVEVGAFNREVYCELLGVSERELLEMEGGGVDLIFQKGYYQRWNHIQ